MKKIHVIETFTDGLRTIKSHLSDINGKYSVFGSVDAALVSGETSDLVILLANRNVDHFKRDLETLYKASFFSKIPVIVCLPFKTAETKPAAEIVGEIPAFELPVSKLSFLSTVAKFLKIPPRRVLQIVITAQPEESNIKYTGMSIDFSETGMAFRSNADFSVGSTIMVNFVNPASRTRLFLKARVARRTDIRHDNIAFYGVNFQNITSDISRELQSFVTGEN